MPRAIWSGAISFGLVNVPIKLYSATSQKTVRFHHSRTGNRIDRWLLGGNASALRVLPGADGDWRIAVAGRW